MWLWIIIGIAVASIVVWALWPRRRGIADGDVLRARESTLGAMEQSENSNRRNFPMGGGF